MAKLRVAPVTGKFATRDPALVGALAGALVGALLAAGPHAAQAGPQGTEVVPIQYYQQPYGGGYDRDRDRGRERDRDRYGYGRDRDEGDRYGRDRYDPRRQEGNFGRGGGAGGSFQRSCTDVRQNGSQLTATCTDGHGNRYGSTIDVNRCGGQDIANANGFLRCGNVQGNGLGRR